MNSLPIEILTKISSYLSFSDRKSFSLVCLRFNQSIYFKELWENVKFVIGKPILSKIHIQFLNILTNIKFFSVNIEPHELSDILKSTKNLINLDLVICPELFLEHEKLDLYFRKNIDSEVKNVLKNLQGLNLSGNKTTITDDGFNCFIENCCCLRSLELSELDIENLSNIRNWSLDEHEYKKYSSQTNWIFIKFLNNISAKSDRLSFSNVISKLISLANSLKVLSLCSTPVGHDELYILSTMPGLNLRVIRLDNCKNLDVKSIRTILDFQSNSLEEISLINSIPISFNLFDNSFFQSKKSLKKIRIRGNGQQREIEIFQKISFYEFQLNYLHLENFYIDDHFVNKLNQIKSINKLYLLGCNFNKLDKNTVLSLIKLTELDLSRSYGFKFNEFIQSVFAQSKLELLKLDWLKINDEIIIGNESIKGLSCLKNLKILSLIGCSNLTGNALSRCLKCMNKIRSFFVQGVKNIDDNFLDNISHVSRVLEEVNFSGSLISDKGLIKFARDAFKLRKIRIDDCCNLTELTAKALPVICPYLQDVSMRNCDQVENPIILNYYDSMFLYQVHNAVKSGSK